MNEKDEWHVLDLVQAERLLLMYKRGIIGDAEVRVRLLTECGFGS